MTIGSTNADFPAPAIPPAGFARLPGLLLLSCP
jgi:hypothetical protein